MKFTNGRFEGLTQNGTRAKTVLAFMVQSMFGKYKDVVCLLPVDRIDTNTLQTWFYKVMEAINEYLFVVAVSTDNHVCNR